MIHIFQSGWPLSLHLMQVVHGSGAGVGGIPHKFMYPKEEKENYQVLQFASQAAGSQGLATYVQQAADTAIKVAHCLHSHI